jgi:hypothetical protein
MPMTDFLGNAILDHLRGGTVYTPPASMWVKLHTGDPGQGTANAAGETTRRQAIFANAASGREVTNTTALAWTAMAQAEDITWASIWDASTDGNCLWTIPLGTIVHAVAGGTYTVAVGQLRLAFVACP